VRGDAGARTGRYSHLLNLLEAFVFRTLAVPTPEQLVGIYPVWTESSVGFPPATLAALRARQQALTGICGVTAGYGALNVQVGAGIARQRPVEAVSGKCYELIGVTPSSGGPSRRQTTRPPSIQHMSSSSATECGVGNSRRRLTCWARLCASRERRSRLWASSLPPIAG
jgi:hypothetical protein